MIDVKTLIERNIKRSRSPDENIIKKIKGSWIKCPICKKMGTYTLRLTTTRGNPNYYWYVRHGDKYCYANQQVKQLIIDLKTNSKQTKLDDKYGSKI